MHRKLKKYAKRLARIASQTYKEIEIQSPNLNQSEIAKSVFFKHIGIDISKVDERVRRKIQVCSKTLNGFCYIKGLDFGDLRGSMNFRCTQFTFYVDKELENLGFPALSESEKIELLGVMEFPTENWKEWRNSIS